MPACSRTIRIGSRTCAGARSRSSSWRARNTGSCAISSMKRRRNEEQATLQKEELEFRHAVGELDESQTADRLKEPLAALDRAATDRTALDQHATRFIQALGSEAIAAGEPEPSAIARRRSTDAVSLGARRHDAGAERRRTTGRQPWPGTAADRRARRRTSLRWRQDRTSRVSALSPLKSCSPARRRCWSRTRRAWPCPTTWC